jgi:hypothetical protein
MNGRVDGARSSQIVSADAPDDAVPDSNGADGVEARFGIHDPPARE